MSANDRQHGGEHYKTCAIQPWDFLAATLTAEQFEGYMIGTAIVYLARQRRKGGRLDIEKARHYLDKLLECGMPDPTTGNAPAAHGSWLFPVGVPGDSIPTELEILQAGGPSHGRLCGECFGVGSVKCAVCCGRGVVEKQGDSK